MDRHRPLRVGLGGFRAAVQLVDVTGVVTVGSQTLSIGMIGV